MTKEFKKRLLREIRLALYELRSGCVECLALKTFCDKHRTQAMDIALHPRKYLKLEAKK